MRTIIFILILVALSVVLIFVSSVFGMAIKNCVRLDGTLSGKRTASEIKHFTRYCGAIAGIIVFVFMALHFSVLAVHTYIIPMDIVNAVVKLYEADPEAWEHEIKEGPIGNLDQQFEDWSHRQGYDPHTPEILADFLFQNWLTLTALGVVTVGLIGLLQIKVFLKLTRYYASNILRRRAAYKFADYHRLEEENAADHVDITVPSIDAAVAFFGVIEPPFKVRRDVAPSGDSRRVDIGTDQCYVTLREPNGEAEAVVDHISWLVEDFESVVKRLDESGYGKAVDSEPGAPHKHACYCDSAGLKWDIAEYHPDDSWKDCRVD